MGGGTTAAIADNGGSDGPVPYDVTGQGLTLPDGDTFADGGHVNIEYTIDGEEGKSGLHFESQNNQPGAEFIGKNSITWEEYSQVSNPNFDIGSSEFCITWVQIDKYNEHFGEGGQEPECSGGGSGENGDQNGDTKGDESADEKSDESSDEQSDKKSDESSDEQSDKKGDESADEKSDESSDEQSDKKSDQHGDQQSDQSSDEHGDQESGMTGAETADESGAETGGDTSGDNGGGDLAETGATGAIPGMLVGFGALALGIGGIALTRRHRHNS